MARSKRPSKAELLAQKQAKTCFWLRLGVLANICLLLFFALAIPLLQDNIENSPVLDQLAKLKQLEQQQQQSQQRIYRQQQTLDLLVASLIADKPDKKLIALSRQLIKQEADFQDFIYYSQRASLDLAKLIDAQEWAYSKSRDFRPFIDSSRKRQLMLRQLAKQLKQAQPSAS